MNLIEEIPILMKEKFAEFFYKNIENSNDYLKLWQNYINYNSPYQSLILFNDICFFNDLSLSLIHKENKKSKESNFLIFLKKIDQNLKKVIEYKNEIKTENFVQFNQYLNQIIHHKDIIAYFISNQVEDITSFDYFFLPKFSIAVQNSNTNEENPFEKFSKNFKPPANSSIFDSNSLLNRANFLKLCIQSPKFEVFLIAVNYKLNYEFNFLSLFNNYIYTPMSTRLYVSILSGIASHSEILVTGNHNSGKRELLKVIFI